MVFFVLACHFHPYRVNLIFSQRGINIGSYYLKKIIIIRKHKHVKPDKQKLHPLFLFVADADTRTMNTIRSDTFILPLKFLMTNFFEAPLFPEATAEEVLAIPLVLCSVMAEKLALLSCRVSSAIIRLALWLNAVWFN